MEAIRRFMENAGELKNLTKKDVEIVITQYDQELNWTKPIAHLCTIYSKGVAPYPPWLTDVRRVPNQGHDAETILLHIITNYNSLAKITFFCRDNLEEAEQPLVFYCKEPNEKEVRGVTEMCTEEGTMKRVEKITGSHCECKKSYEEFRDKILHITYRKNTDRYVKGNFMSVGKTLIQSKPLEYYKKIYEDCGFNRGIAVEELWFLNYSFYSIFTRKVNR
jgi:hypothetical protein